MRWLMVLAITTALSSATIYPDAQALWHDHKEQFLAARAVLIGERHTEAAHHHTQLELIKRLAANGPVAIAMEAFSSSQQGAIAAYMSGEWDEDTFLEQSGWFEHWGYDYGLYAPVIAYAKESQIPLFGINLDRSEHRDRLDHNESGELDLALFRPLLPEREKLLRAIFDRHPAGGNFDRFVFGQLLWEAHMADRAAAYLAHHPKHQLVILAGNGHLGSQWGIGAKLKRLGVAAVVSIIQDANTSLKGDYHLDPPPVAFCGAPVLGVIFDGDLSIQKVMAGSLGDRGGLQMGDRLIALNTQRVEHISSVRLGLYQARSESELVVQVEREGELTTLWLPLKPCRGSDTHWPPEDPPPL